MYFFYLVILLIFIASLAYYKIRYPFVEQINKIPGPDGFPFVGMTSHFHTMPRNMMKTYFNELFDEFGPVYRTWIGPVPLIHVGRAEWAQKSELYQLVKPWLGVSLPIMGGEEWHKRRKLLGPTFSFSVLNGFIGVMEKNSRIFIERLEEKIDAEEFDIYPYITDCSVDITAETIMSVQLNAQKGSSKTYVHSVEKLSQLLFKKFLNPFLHVHFINVLTKNHSIMQKLIANLHEMSFKIIEKRLAQRKEAHFKTTPTEQDVEKEEGNGRTKNKTFLDILLDKYDAGEGDMTLQNIREEVDSFMFAGHDTTAVAMAFTIFLVGHHPEVQERIHAELDTVMPSEDIPINAQTLTQLKYLEWALLDALRLYPPGPIIARRLKEPVTSGGCTIPAGSEVLMHFHRIHRSAKYFPNPYKFDPLNFSPERVNNIHPYAFLPFSAGPRNCIGMKFAKYEAKTALAMFFRKYEVTSTTRIEDLKLFTEIILRPEHGIKVRIKPRNRHNS